jgi:antirestriction protein ArdC
VFNVCQIDGLPEAFYVEPDPAMDLGTRPDAALEAYFARSGARIETTAEPRAYYHPGRDMIHMPPVATFHETSGYYDVLGHETVHWTGGEARLDRITRCASRCKSRRQSGPRKRSDALTAAE